MEKTTMEKILVLTDQNKRWLSEPLRADDTEDDTVVIGLKEPCSPDEVKLVLGPFVGAGIAIKVDIEGLNAYVTKRPPGVHNKVGFGLTVCITSFLVRYRPKGRGLGLVMTGSTLVKSSFFTNGREPDAGLAPSQRLDNQGASCVTEVGHSQSAVRLNKAVGNWCEATVNGILQVKLVFAVTVLRATQHLPHRIILNIYVPDTQADPKTVPAYARCIGRRSWRYDPLATLENMAYCRDLHIATSFFYDAKPDWAPEEIRFSPALIRDAIFGAFKSLTNANSAARELQNVKEDKGVKASTPELEWGCGMEPSTDPEPLPAALGRMDG
ncbi:hypothetical protein MKEN_01224100 [Mycena kentingensis (nom. inval.)]|nr:hypothetical protein MKEN_01224100 [Mycena kentingensis (nom. inval.)]